MHIAVFDYAVRIWRRQPPGYGWFSCVSSDWFTNTLCCELAYTEVIIVANLCDITAFASAKLAIPISNSIGKITRIEESQISGFVQARMTGRINTYQVVMYLYIRAQISSASANRLQILYLTSSAVLEIENRAFSIKLITAYFLVSQISPIYCCIF